MKSSELIANLGLEFNIPPDRIRTILEAIEKEKNDLIDGMIDPC